VAVLPIYFGDPESSLKAMMIFPREPDKAAALAAWLSIRDLRRGVALGHADTIAPTLSPDAMKEFLLASCAASEFAPLYDEARRNLRTGAQVAITVSYLWAFICKEGHGASWERAIKAAEIRKVPGSRSSFFTALKAFKPVLHLLGARVILKRTGGLGDVETTVRFAGHPDPAVDYPRRTDVLVFAEQARLLQLALLWWDSKRPSKGRMFDEMFDLIGPWTPPPRQPQWPNRRRIRVIGLDRDIAADTQFIKRKPGPKSK
jgi:hypothetical protein